MTAARAVLVGDGPGVLAEFVAAASATDEFTDRWRAPGDRVSKLWEERFGENRYLALGQEALGRALEAAGLEAGDIGRLVVTGMHGRAVSGLTKKLGLAEGVAVDDLTSSVGQSGTAHPLLVLASALESMAASAPASGTPVVVVHLADGADAVVLRTTDALTGWRPMRGVNDPDRQRGPDHLRQVPVVAGPAAARAAAPSRAGPGVEHGCPSQRGAGSSGSWVRRTAAPAPCTCRPHGCPWRAAPSTTWSRWPWPTPPARW